MTNYLVPASHELATVSSLNMLFCRPESIDSAGYFLSKSSITMDRWTTALESPKGGWTAMNIALKARTVAMTIVVRLPEARYAQPEAKSSLDHGVILWLDQR